MANHSSNLDPPVLLPLLPGRVVIYLKASLMKIPVLGYAMRLAGFIPVQRDGSVESAKAASAVAQRALEQGSCLVLFPEGNAVAGWIAAALQEGAVLSGDGVGRAGSAGVDSRARRDCCRREA